MITPTQHSGVDARSQLAPGSAVQRSLIYQQLCVAFSYPDTELESSLALPDRAKNAGTVYLEAFDRGVSTRACSLHETDHCGTERTALFEELLRFYSYFGLARVASSELPDHLTVELEFLHFLSFLQHRTEQKGNPATDIIRAQYDFLTRHLLRLTRGIVAEFNSDDRHYVALVSVLGEFMEQEFLQLRSEHAGSANRS